MPRLTITVPDKVAQPYRFSLERQIVHFGRGDDNDIHIDSGSVSSEHAVMERIIGGYVLKDLGSTNGIKLDGQRVDKIQLRNGQNIQIGDADFGFLLSDEEMTALRLEDPISQLPSLNEPPIEKSSNSIVETVDLKSPPPPEPKPEPKPLQQQPKPKPEPLPDLPPEPQPDIRQLPPEHIEPQAQRQPQIQIAPQSGAALAAALLENSKFNKLIGLLAALAFLAGVAMHFQYSTKHSLLNAVMHKLGGDKAAP